MIFIKKSKSYVIKLREKIYTEITKCEYKNWYNTANTAKTLRYDITDNNKEYYDANHDSGN